MIRNVVVMGSPIFDEFDIRTLVCHPQTSKRAGAAQRLCETYRSANLSKTDRAVATRLLRAMAEDAAKLVRAALAVTLHNSPDLPRDVALKLVEDVDAIAVPIINFSPVLTDEDLVTVLRSRAAAKIRACARRASVSVSVSRAIIRFGDGPAVANLAANDGAQIDEDTAREMVRLWHNDDLVTEAMVARRDMPIDILEVLVAHTSAETVLALQDRGVSPHRAADVANRSRERATLEIARSVPHDMDLLVGSLSTQGRLTGSAVLRAICQGHMGFAETALSKLADLPLSKVRMMLHDGGPFGVTALADRAGLPLALHEVIATAMRIHRDLANSGEIDRHRYTRTLVERLATSGLELGEDDRRYVMERLDAA